MEYLVCVLALLVPLAFAQFNNVFNNQYDNFEYEEETTGSYYGEVREVFPEDPLEDFGGDFGGDFAPPFDPVGPAGFGPAGFGPAGFGPGAGGLGAGGFGAGAGGGAAACFSKDVEVETVSGERLTMDKIRIGDRLMTIEDGVVGYSPVVGFVHRLPESNVEYRHLELEGGEALSLTEKHFIYRAPCGQVDNPEMVYAEDVKVGDCLIKVQDTRVMSVKVLRHTTVRKVGAYAPMTHNGIVVTNNIMSSCHSVYGNKKVMDEVTYLSDKVKAILGWLTGTTESGPETELPWLLQFAQNYMNDLVLMS